MKRFKVFICLLLVALLLSGCSFRISSSIDELISPLSPFGDNADIKNALDSYAAGGYSLKLPNSGSNIASYNFVDIDGDKNDEAIAFYEPADKLGTVDMALIKKSGKNWKVIHNLEGIGKDVHSLELCDVTGDGKNEIIVCWDVISNSYNHELTVYTCDLKKDDADIKQIEGSISVNNYISINLIDDNTKELLMFEVNPSNVKAELYSLTDGYFSLRGETKLDSHITTFASIKTDNSDGFTKVYADAVGSDGKSMMTDVIFWSDDYNTIISPLYSYSTGVTEGTTRSAAISTLDVNGDKRLDIPTDYNMSKLPDEISAIEFKVYKSTILMHSAYAFYSKGDSYIVVIPDKYFSKIRAKYNSNTNEMTLINKTTKKTVVKIMPVLKATYDESNYAGYQKVVDNNGYCYLAAQGDDKDIVITTNELSKLIKPIKR